MSVAQRVADERGERLGESVGYQVRWLGHCLPTVPYTMPPVP